MAQNSSKHPLLRQPSSQASATADRQRALVTLLKREIEQRSDEVGICMRASRIWRSVPTEQYST